MEICISVGLGMWFAIMGFFATKRIYKDFDENRR